MKNIGLIKWSFDMKKMLCVMGLILCFAVQGQVPTKLFDVRNGNGIVDGANTYAAATYVVFKDAAAKSAIIDAFADNYGYLTTINGVANPQSKQAFFNYQLQTYIREVYRTQKIKDAAKAASDTAGTAANVELP